MPTPRRLVCKILLPDRACGKFIGEKGRRIQELQNSSNTLINLSRKGEYFPNTDNKRVISISGFTIESLLTVITAGMDASDFYNDHGTLARCILVTSTEGAETLLTDNSRVLNTICTRDRDVDGLSVMVQDQGDADPVIRERYIKIFSMSNELYDVRECVEKLLKVICHESVKQPLHLRVYSSSSTSSKMSNSINGSRDQWGSRDFDKTSSEEFRKMESTWKEVMGPSLWDNNRAGVDEDTESEYFDWMLDNFGSYTVYKIERDFAGEPVFVKVN